MEEYQAHFKFENLKIWQKAMDFGEMIFDESRNFPKEETYNLISQARRAADSIALNIAEGSISQSNPEFIKFINYAVRSLAEVVTCLHKAKRRAYISEVDFDKFYQDSYNLMNMMIAFRNKLS